MILRMFFINFNKKNDFYIDIFNGLFGNTKERFNNDFSYFFPDFRLNILFNLIKSKNKIYSNIHVVKNEFVFCNGFFLSDIDFNNVSRSNLIFSVIDHFFNYKTKK